MAADDSQKPAPKTFFIHFFSHRAYVGVSFVFFFFWRGVGICSQLNELIIHFPSLIK